MEFNKYKKLGAYHWDSAKNSEYRRKAKAVVNLFPYEGTMIDLGCGDGYVSEQLRLRGLDVDGIDIDPLGIKFAKEKSQAKFEAGDITKISTNKQYDYGLLMEVLEHLEKPELMLPILKKIIKRYVVVTVPTTRVHDPLHYREYTDEMIKDFFKGWEWEKIDNSGLASLLYIFTK